MLLDTVTLVRVFLLTLLSRGFSAKVNAKTLESVSASSESYATIEEDKVVSTL